MSKHRYSLTACADAIEHLADIANSSRIKPRASELELLTEQARQVIDMLREPIVLAAILTALGELDRIRLEPANRS